MSIFRNRNKPPRAFVERDFYHEQPTNLTPMDKSTWMTRPLELYCPFDGTKLDLPVNSQIAPMCTARVKHTFDVQFSARMNEMVTITFRELT